MNLLLSHLNSNPNDLVLTTVRVIAQILNI